ncbi:prephenate dehydrogenase (NADP(+)) [Ranunculus cassubicifolius]
MASFHLYCHTPNLHQIQTNLFPMKALAPQSTNIPRQFILKSSELRGCELKSLAERHALAVSHADQSTIKRRESPLKIGIVGLGAFGQFLAKAFQRQGHDVIGNSRSDYSEYCHENGIEFFQDLDGLCEAQPDVLLICSSILSTEKVVRGIPFHKLKPDTIIADVLSVKQHPKTLFLDVVPDGFGILCTHPMFGKYSGNKCWEGLRFVYDKVRVTENSVQERNCEQFLDIFQDEGCRMVEMTCEEHDLHAAESQFITHTVARILSNMEMEATPIDTKGYETLMELTQNTVSHGSDLYDGLFLYNVNSAKQIKKFEKAFDTVKKTLFGKLRDSFKKQIEETESTEVEIAPNRSSQFLPGNKKVMHDVSSFATISEHGYIDAHLEFKKEVYYV